MNDDVTSPLQLALASTFQLSPGGAGRLRRLTAASGLASENVLSRVAIVRSLQESSPVTLVEPRKNAKGKEIRGHTLFGRGGNAALLVAMILQSSTVELENGSVLRNLIVAHWERGLSLLHKESGGGSVTDQVARRLSEDGAPAGPSAAERVGGHGNTERDEIAASLGREFGVLPIEVRRILALAGRFDTSASRAAAQRLLDDARQEGKTRVSESIALQTIERWGLNRLGMTVQDRAAMRLILSGARPNAKALSTGQLDSLEFLCKLRLVRANPVDDSVEFSAGADAVELGEGSWLT